MEKNVTLNCNLYAVKNSKGFIVLYLQLEDINTQICVCDFNGLKKKQARLLTYKLYKKLGN